MSYLHNLLRRTSKTWHVLDVKPLRSTQKAFILTVTSLVGRTDLQNNTILLLRYINPVAQTKALSSVLNLNV